MILRMLSFAILIPGAALADIQPNDGHWRGVWEMKDAKGCPPGMAEQMANAAAKDRSYARDMTFPTPFDPVAMNQAVQGDFKWVRLGENLWETRYVDAKGTQLGQLVVDVRMVLSVIDPDEMDQEVFAEVTFPAQIAQMAGMAGNRCEWSAHVDHKRDG